MSDFNWHGPEMKAKVERALMRGIDKTTSQAAITAKRLVHIDTSTLQGSISPDPARVEGDEVVGQFSTHDVAYAKPQEFLPPEKGGKPYMRPAADEAAKNLAGNIRKAWEEVT